MLCFHSAILDFVEIRLHKIFCHAFEPVRGAKTPENVKFPVFFITFFGNLTYSLPKQYLLFVVVIGGFPTVLSNTMSFMLRNTGYSREAGFGLGPGGVLNIVLDPLFMFVILPDGYQVMGAGIATMLSNVIALRPKIDFS